MLQASHSGFLHFSILLGVCNTATYAQDALRDSLAGEKAAVTRKQALETQPYNVKAGPVNLLFDSSISFELNDNVNLSESNRQEDLILRPLLNVRANWPVTEKNALNLAVGFSYAKYMNQSQYDRFLIAPGSELSFDVFVSDFRFTLYDRVSYTQDPVQQGAVSGSAVYGGLSNTAGLTTLWDLNKLILSLTYGHVNFISASSSFSSLDSTSEQLFARAAYLLNPTTTIGFEASGEMSRYDQHFLNDRSSFSAGLFSEWKATEYLQISPRAGYVGYLFDSNGLIGRTRDVNTLYASLGVNHRINEHISHSLEGGREFQAGINSDVIDLIYVRYGVAFSFLKNVALAPQFNYEHGRQPGSTFQENYDRFGIGLSLAYQITQKMNGRLAYLHYTKDSDVAQRNYAQNSLTLELGYRF